VGDGVGFEAQLREDLANVTLHGLELERKRLGDALVRASLGHQPEDLSFATRQLVEW
jgi:hypothetical protein